MGKTKHSQAYLIGRRPKWPMSAYKASPPVMASTTAPMARKAASGSWQKKFAAYQGLMAASTEGCLITPTSPSRPSMANQNIMTGPNSAATLAVPRRWNTNKATMTTMVMGTTYGLNRGVATSRPSTADSTDMAGVMT